MITKTDKKHILKEFNKRTNEWREKVGWKESPTWYRGLADGYGVIEDILDEMLIEG